MSTVKNISYQLYCFFTAWLNFYNSKPPSLVTILDYIGSIALALLLLLGLSLSLYTGKFISNFGVEKIKQKYFYVTVTQLGNSHLLFYVLFHVYYEAHLY